MTAILDAVTGLVESCRQAGVRATLDTRNLNLPTLLIIPPSYTGDLMCGGTGTFTVFALTRGPANLDAWKSLDGQLEQLMDIVDEIRQVVPTSYDPENTGGMPAFEITFEHSLTWT